MLATAGFKDVFSIEGGIRAWDGMTATGAPETGLAYFPEKASTEELIALAWLLEDGNRKFYSEIPALTEDKEVGDLFQKLVSAEQKHQEALTALYIKVTGKNPKPDFPGSLLASATPEGAMEGGILVAEALAWAKGRTAADVLELAMALEINSYDLYIKMERKVADEHSKKVFSVLSIEEKNHLDLFSALLDRKI